MGSKRSVKNRKGEELPIPRGLMIREFKTGPVFQVAFSFRGRQCRETLKGVKVDEKGLLHAQLQLNNLRVAIANGTFDYGEWFPKSASRNRVANMSAKTTLREFAKHYVGTFWDSKERSTQAGYDTWLHNRILPELGDRQLGELDREALVTFLRAQATSIKLKSLRNLGSVLRMILAEAQEQGLIAKNPLATIKLKSLSPKHMQGEREAEVIDPFTLAEMMKIVEAATGQMKNLIEVWRWVGLRTSEILALRWRDVDFERRILRVEVAFVLGEEKGPKTRKGRREVELCEPAIAALREQQALTGKHERVFIDLKTNLPLTVSNDIYSAWREIIRKAQVRYRRPYQCRHTYASTMLTAGANHRWLADQLGHEDVATLFAHYGKFIPENTRRSVDDVVANALSSWESATHSGTVDALVDAAESHEIHTDDEDA